MDNEWIGHMYRRIIMHTEVLLFLLLQSHIGIMSRFFMCTTPTDFLWVELLAFSRIACFQGNVIIDMIRGWDGWEILVCGDCSFELWCCYASWPLLKLWFWLVFSSIMHACSKLTLISLKNWSHSSIKFVFNIIIYACLWYCWQQRNGSSFQCIESTLNSWDTSNSSILQLNLPYCLIFWIPTVVASKCGAFS